MTQDNDADAKAGTAAETTDTKKPTVAVKVYSPFEIYYEGEAYCVNATNATGPFDVLPHHHQFLCMLVPCTLTIQAPDGEHKVKISRALMHVKAERVVVFVNV